VRRTNVGKALLGQSAMNCFGHGPSGQCQ
jgi:hypothetical protein